jgi:hypothetical protein
MDGTKTFRASGEEIATYDRAWRRLGFRSQSQFHREAANMMATSKGKNYHAVSPTIALEINTHLNRIGSSLTELVALAANDNLPDSPRFVQALAQALSDIKTIKRRVS